MNRLVIAAAFAALTAFAVGGCKSNNNRSSMPTPTPVSGTVKPEVKVGPDVAIGGTGSDVVAFADEGVHDAYDFDGLAHTGDCTEDHLGEAKGLVEGGQVSEAVSELELGIYDRPDDFEMRRTLGELYGETGELELAVGHLRIAVDLVDDSGTWLALAQTYYELQDFDQSLKATKKVISLDPTNPEPHRLQAKVFQSKSMWKESIEACEEAIARGSDSPWTYNNMGYAYLVLGHYEDAVRELEKAVSFDTGVSATIWNNLGLAYEKKGDLRDSVAAYNAALAGRPDYVKAKVNLGRVTTLAKAQGIDIGTRTADVSRTPVEVPEVPEVIEIVPSDPAE